MLQVSSKKNTEKTIALDFDGVIHSYTSGWTGPVPKDPPVEGVLSFIASLFELGYNVVIFSCRASTKSGRNGITKWLKDNSFPEIEVFYEKPQADLYVDDNGFRFDGNFAKTLNFIKRL